jgi:membrane protease YdiL (CAAX protease family)
VHTFIALRLPTVYAFANIVTNWIMPGSEEAEEAQRSLPPAPGLIQAIFPEQKNHFLFVIGSLFLYAGAFAPWIAWRRLFAELAIPRSDVLGWSLYVALPIRGLLLFAAIKSFWVYCLGGNAPGRTILSWVFPPMLLSMALFCLSIVRLVVRPTRSVLETGEDVLHRGLGNLSCVPTALGAGFYFAVAGLVLLGVGVWRLNRGLTTLPVRFVDDNPPSLSEGSKNDPARAIVLFCSIAFALPPFISYLAGLAIVFVPTSASHLEQRMLLWSEELVLLAASSVPTLSALYVLGGDRKAKLLHMLRFSSLKSYGLALSLPAVVIGVPQCIYYCAVRWMRGIGEPFAIEWHNLSMIPLSWAVTLVVAALFEEIGWRGYLQPMLVSRFGVRRGILLVGLIWGAFHLSDDLSSLAELGSAVSRLATRLLFVTILAVALGWLRMYSGSVLPVAAMHAGYNILLQNVHGSRLPFKPPGAIWATMGAWALVGLLLFSCWPPRETELPIPPPPAC